MPSQHVGRGSEACWFGKEQAGVAGVCAAADGMQQWGDGRFNSNRVMVCGTGEKVARGPGMMKGE